MSHIYLAQHFQKTLLCQGFQSIKQPHQIRKSHRLVRIGWGHSSCLVLTEKMRSGKCTTVQSVESSIMTTKPLTKSTSCCGSRSCGLYKIRPQRKGQQTCRFFLCDLKIMNLLQNQRGRCIDSGSQLLIEHIQTLGVSAE